MSQSIAFIDSTLAQNNLTLQDFDGQVYTIPEGEDGIAYMSEVLKGHKDLAAIHLFSHGTEAEITIGDKVLSSEISQEDAELLRSWQSALAPDADLLVYGCNVAKGSAGKAFIEEISELTGADVAASEDLTGTAENADWQMEVASGDIQATTAALSSKTGETFSLNTINEANPGTVRIVDNDRGPFQDDEDDWDITKPGSYDDRFDGDPDVDEINNVPDSFIIRFDGETYGSGSHGGQGDDIGGGTIYVYWNVDDNADVWNGSNSGAVDAPFWNSGNPQTLNGIHVFGGNDTVYANGGNDKVYGGSGNDTLYGGTGNDVLYGESGNDKLYGDENNDTLYGGTGTDTLKGGSGTDTLHGGDNNDTLYGNEDNDTLHGDGGDDILYGNSGSDTLHGGSGNNTIYAGDSSDEDPNTGRHTITSGTGDDSIYGSKGEDIVTVDGGTNTIDTYGGNDNIKGGSGTDTINAGKGNDKVYGRAGDDIIHGNEGNDYIESGSGNDQLFGDAGDDTLVYGHVSNSDLTTTLDNEGNVRKNPNTRNDDELALPSGSTWNSATGNVTVDGGTGIDTLRVVGEYSDFNIESETLADGNMRFVVSDRTNANNKVTATNIEKIEFWNNYRVFNSRDIHNRNGVILPIRYELEVLQHATETLYETKTEVADSTKIGKVKVQLKDWQNPTLDYVVEGSETEPGTKRDEYLRGNGLAVKYEIVVKGNFGPEETEFLSDKLRFKRVNLETGRSTKANGDGLDYVTESFVVVQPGESSATINILPIVDEIQEGLESVEVRVVAVDQVEINSDSAASAYVYQEGFLYNDIKTIDGQVGKANNNAENDVQDGINKGYVLLPTAQGGDKVTVNINDSGLFKAGIRLVDEYGFQVGEEALLQDGSAKVFVGLTSRPAETVTVKIAGQNYVFTSDRNTWNQTQAVTLTGAPNSTVAINVSSTDSFYSSLAPRNLKLVTDQSVLQIPEPVALQIGSGNYIDIPNVALTGDFAIELWVNPTEDGILLQTDSGTLSITNGKLQGTGSLIFAGNQNNTLSDQQWHRLTFLSVGNEIRVYVDGELAGRQVIAPNTSLTLQSIGAATNSIQGLVSNLRFSDQVVLDNDLYIGTLQAQYNLDEGSGTLLNNQAPKISGGDATIRFNNTDALLWKAGVPLADPSFQEILSEEANTFGLINRNFDFPDISVSIPADQQQTTEGSEQFAAFELLLSKDAPRGGITVSFDLNNLSINQPGRLQPNDQSSSDWTGTDFEISTVVDSDGTTQKSTIDFGKGFTGTLYIPEGARKGTVYLTAPEDLRAEGNQTIQLSLNSVTNADDSRYQVATGQGVVSIIDTDRPGVEILKLQNTYTYNTEAERAEETNQLVPAERVVTRETDDGAMTLRFNLDDLTWDAQGNQTATINITDTAGLSLTTTKLDLNSDRRFAVTTITGDYIGKKLNGILTIDGPEGSTERSFSLDLLENKELTDAEQLRLNSNEDQEESLQKTFEQGSLLLTAGGDALPIRAHQSSWNEYVYVQLTSAPVDNGEQVVVDLTATGSITGTQEVELSATSLTFTSENWDQPQIVGIRGIDDGLADNSQVGQITAAISIDPSETTDRAYQFGGNQANLLYLNVATPAPSVEITNKEIVDAAAPPNPANPTYRFESDLPTRKLTITEGETAEIKVTTDAGSTTPLKGRYKVVETGLERSLQLSGNQQRIDLDQSATLTDDLTIQLAFRWDGNRDENQPVQLLKATNGHGDIFINVENKLEVHFKDAQGQISKTISDIPLLANEEYSLSVIVEGTTSKLYADGQLVGTGTIGTSAAPVEIISAFGSADTSQVDNFRGIVYGARFWNQAMSQSDVRRFSNAVLNPAPVLFTLDEANDKVFVSLNPEVVTSELTTPVDLTFRRYSYTGGLQPEVADVKISFSSNNASSQLALPFDFNGTQSLTADIQSITLQIESQSPQLQNSIFNVGDTHALEVMRSQHLVDEISPLNLERFGLRANALEDGATQGVDFESLEGVVVRKGEAAGLPLSGARYLGDQPAIVTGDLTGDGKADLLVLSEKAGNQFYENISTEPGELKFKPQEDKSKVETDAAGQGFNGSEGRLIDADGDGELDLVWSENGGLKVQLNTPSGGVAFAGSTAAGDFLDQAGVQIGSGQADKTVAFDFADFNQDGVLDAVILDENNNLQTYFGNNAFELIDGLVQTSAATNPFRNITLPEDKSLAIKVGNVIADGLPELYVYERGDSGSYWRFLMPELETAENGAQELVYRDRTFLDPLTARAGEIGDLESLSFLNPDGADSVFLSKENGHYKFGTVTEVSNEITLDGSNSTAEALIKIKSLQDNTVELNERVRLQLQSTDDLTANQGSDRTVDIIIQDDDRPGVTLSYANSSGANPQIVTSHFTASDNPDLTQAEGQKSDGFYILSLDSKPQESVSLFLRNNDSDRLQFERIHPLSVTINNNGSLSIGSRLANAANDYTLEFKSDLVESATRDGQGHYQIQLKGDTTTALQSAIAGKSLSEIQNTAAVQNILKQVTIQINSDNATYRGGLGLDANKLLQERISITPQEQMKFTVLPDSWEQQILLRPVLPENLIDNQNSPNPKLSIAIDSSDAVYASLPVLLSELPITDNDTASIVINQLDDIREGVDGGQFQVSLGSKPEGTVLVTLSPNDLDDTGALALNGKYYGDSIDLEFTQYNWNAPQTVSVRAQDDNAVTGDLQRQITASVRSDDPNYAGIDVTPVNVTIRDNDLPTVSTYTVLDAAEPGQIGFFGLRLNTDQLRNPEGLKIHYRVRGWASAPASADDYQSYTDLTPNGENFITIAPGQDIGNVAIFPIDDYIAEGFDITFKPSNVDQNSDRISITEHRLINGAKVVFTPESSGADLPEGLTDDSFYYVSVIDANTIELYQDANRTQKVDLTSGGIGEVRLLDATGKSTVEEAKENTKRFEAVELELLSDPNGSNPGYQLAGSETTASVRIYDNEEVGFRFILPGQQVLNTNSPAEKGYLNVAEHPDINNAEEFSAATFLVRPLSDPGIVETGDNAGDDNWVSLRFDPRWDQNNMQEMQVHLAEEPNFEDDGTQTVTIAIYDQYGRKIQFYQRDPDKDGAASDELTDQLEITVTKDNWAEPIRLKSAVFFDLNGNQEWDEGEHKGVTLSDSTYDFGENLASKDIGKDKENFDVTLDTYDLDQDGKLSLFEVAARSANQDGWGVVSDLANASAIAVQVGDDIGKVAIKGDTDVAVDRWNRFAVFTSFAADTADTTLQLDPEDGVPDDTNLPSDYNNDPYRENDKWKENSVYFDSNNWTRFQSVKITALDDKTYDIDRILPLEVKVYENEGNNGFYAKKFQPGTPSPLVLTVKDRRLDNETVTGSLSKGFSQLEKIIHNYELPLVGSLSGKLPTFLTDFIRDFSRNLEQQRYITGPSLASALSDALNEQLDGTGVEIELEYDADEQTISLSIAFGKDYDLFEIGLDSELGLPALGLETEGSLSSIFHFDLRVGVSLNLKEKTFTVDISEDENGSSNTGADANVFLDLNSFKATGNIAFLKAELQQIPLDDFINGHKPQITVWLDEEPNSEDDQTVKIRAFDIGGDEIDLDLTSGATFASYEKNADNWKHPLILEGLDYDGIDEIEVEFNGKKRRFRVNFKGEQTIDGVKVDAQLFNQDAHDFFKEYDGDKDILGALEKDAESESLLAKGDTHSEAALGVGFALLGEKAVEIDIERKYAFAIEAETEAQTIPTLYIDNKEDGTENLANFLDDKGPQDGTVSITLEGIDNNSEDINLFTVELFKLVDPNRESFDPSAEEDNDFFAGMKLDPINFTLGAATVDEEEVDPQNPRLPLHRQLNAGGSSNSALFRDINGYAIDFTTGGESGNLELGSDIVFRLTKAQTSDGLPNGTFYYIQPFNEEKAIHQVVDYLVVNGSEEPTEGGTPLEVSFVNPDATENKDKNELVDIFLIQGENVTIQGAETGGSLTRLKLDNAEGFEVSVSSSGEGNTGGGGTGSSTEGGTSNNTETKTDTYALTETGVPVREDEVGISQLGSRAKELFDYTLNGSVGAAFNVVTSVAGKTSFPSLSLDLGVVAQAEKAKGEAFEASLAVGLKDLGLDLGSFITKFAAPIVEAVDSIFEPIKPFISALNADTQFLEYIGLESQFDKDANGEASFIEIALVLSELSAKRGNAEYAKFFETVVKVLDFIDTIDKLAAQLDKGDNLVIPLLDQYHVEIKPGNKEGDAESEDTQESQAAQTKDNKLPEKGTDTSTVTHQETKPALPGADGIKDQAEKSDNQNASSITKLLNKINSIEGLQFPILQDPISLVNLLFGKDVNIVLYEVPNLKLELNPRAEFYPLPPFPIKGILEGKFEAGANLGFGYDTYGFRQWANADFDIAESYQIFDGFFLADWTADSYKSANDSGIDDKPELYATAEIGAGVEVGVGLTGYAGVGVGATVNFDLEDKGEVRDDIGTSDGKVRGSEIIAGINDPLSLFELYGRVYAFFKALVELDLGLFSVTLFEQKWEFDLFKFQVGGAKQGGSAVQSEVVGATVFFDANHNLKLDEGEPWSITTGDGSYSFAIDITDFDLNNDGKLTLEDGQIIVIGGLDKESGLPIVNPMIASPDSTIVSPLTTLSTQIAVNNNGDTDTSTALVKNFFDLPEELDLGSFHPINAIRNGSNEEAALGLQVYKSHIAIDSLLYNISRIAGSYSETGITADAVIEVVDFVAEKVREAAEALGDNQPGEDHLSNFVEDTVEDFYQEKILPTLTGEEKAEAIIEKETVNDILSKTFSELENAPTTGSKEEIQQAFENLTPLKTALKTNIASIVDLYIQESITLEEAQQRTNNTLTSAANEAPVANGDQLFTDFDTFQGTTVSKIFGPTFTDDSGDSFHGVAIVSHTPQINLGYWAYYDSNRDLWLTLEEPITPDSAVVLEANTQLRFIPRFNAPETSTPNLSVRLIDQNGQPSERLLKTGDRISFTGANAQPTGGTTAYSANTLSFNTLIDIPDFSMNQPPTLTQTIAELENGARTSEDAIVPSQGDTVGNLFSQYLASDFDNPSVLYGIAISDYKVSNNQGRWEYLTDDDSGWRNVPDINPKAGDNQLLLKTDTRLRFSPKPNYSGEATALSINLIDSRVAKEGFSSGARKNISIDFPNSYTEALKFQTLVDSVNDAPITNLRTTFIQPEAIRISDRAEATTADPSPEAGKGDLFPSILKVSGLLGNIEDISVKLNNLNVTADNNLDIWLEAPNGERVILLSDAGNGQAIDNDTFTFNDSGINALAGNSTPLIDDSVYKPTNNTTAATDLDPSEFSSAATSFSAFIDQPGESLNGEWKLFIHDDTDSGVDAEKFGALFGGWELSFERTAGGFSRIDEDSTAPQGLSVSELFGAHFSDVDGNSLKGVAITKNSAQTTQGEWQYFADDSWQTITQGLTENAALLLSAQTLMRFVPSPDFNGQPGRITARLIDSSHPDFEAGKIQDARFSTTGGPFSQNIISKTITIDPVNDAPTIVDKATPRFPDFLEDTPFNASNAPTIDKLFGNSFQDITDKKNANQNQFIGVAIVQDFADKTGDRTTDMSIAYEKGNWEVYDGSVWVKLPSDLSNSNAYLVPKATKIRFTPRTNYNGELPPLTVHLVDNGTRSALGIGERIDLGSTGTGGTTPYTSESVTLRGNIEAINDFRPTTEGDYYIELTPNGQPEDVDITPIKTVAELFGDRFSDGDQADYAVEDHGVLADAEFWGILIKDQPYSNIGVWQFRANDGEEWTDFSEQYFYDYGEMMDLRLDESSTPEIGDGDGLYLPASYQLRFMQLEEHFHHVPMMEEGESEIEAYLVDGSITQTSIGQQLLDKDGEAIAALASNSPTFDGGTASPISEGFVELSQYINSINDAPVINSELTGETVYVESELQGKTKEYGGISIGYLLGEYFDDSADAFYPYPYREEKVPLEQELISQQAQIVQQNLLDEYSIYSFLEEMTGIAIVENGADPATEGVWQYEVEVNCWKNLPTTLSESNALVLESSTLLRFVPVEGSTLSSTPANLKVALVDRTYRGIIDEASVDLSQRGETTPFTQELLTLSPRVLIEDEGEVDIMATSSQVFISGDDFETTVSFNDADIQASQFPGWKLLAAEKIEEKYHLLWQETQTGRYDIWEISDSGEFVSSTTLNLESIEDLELLEQFDINDFSEYIEGTEKDDNTDLFKTALGKLWISSSDDTKAFIKLNGSIIIADQFPNWEMIAAESIDGENRVLWRNTTTGQFGFWASEDDWNFENSETSTADASQIDKFVEQFDLSPIEIETNGNTSLVKDILNQLQVLYGDDDESNIIFNGKALRADQFPGWEVLAAENTDSNNQLLWHNIQTGQLGLWTLDSDWKVQTSVIVEPGTTEATALLESFSISENEEPTPQEGPDIIIENIGSLTLTRDSNDLVWIESTLSQEVRALDSDEPVSLKLNGSPIYADQFPGWMLVAAEEIDEQPQILWHNAQTQQVGVWILDDSGNTVSSSTLDANSEVGKAVITAFGVKLINNTPILLSSQEIEGSDLDNNFLHGGASDDILVGGYFDDIIVGGYGDDSLDGGYGGRDTLTGGSDADTFWLHAHTQESNYQEIDTITDFNTTEDIINIRVDFSVEGLVDDSGILTSEAFSLGAVTYDATSGALSVKAAGSEDGSTVQIAVLTPNLPLTNSNIALFDNRD